MARLKNTLLLYRENLGRASRHKNIDDIHFFDFMVATERFYTVDLIIFVDENGEAMVLKDRLGQNNVKLSYWRSRKQIGPFIRKPKEFKCGRN